MTHATDTRTHDTRHEGRRRRRRDGDGRRPRRGGPPSGPSGTVRSRPVEPGEVLPYGLDPGEPDTAPYRRIHAAALGQALDETGSTLPHAVALAASRAALRTAEIGRDSLDEVSASCARTEALAEVLEARGLAPLRAGLAPGDPLPVGSPMGRAPGAELQIPTRAPANEDRVRRGGVRR